LPISRFYFSRPSAKSGPDQGNLYFCPGNLQKSISKRGEKYTGPSGPVQWKRLAIWLFTQRKSGKSNQFWVTDSRTLVYIRQLNWMEVLEKQLHAANRTRRSHPGMIPGVTFCAVGVWYYRTAKTAVP
jgi:hypothetical protein